MGFLIIFIIQLLICILIGIKRGALKSAYSICANIVAVIFSFIFSRICVNSFTDSLSKLLLKGLNKALEEDAYELMSTTAVKDVSKFAAVAIISLVSFVLLYLLFLIIFKIVKKILFKSIMHIKYKEYSDNQDSKKKTIGGVLTAISGIITFVILTMPIAVPLHAIDLALKDADNKEIREVQLVINNPTYKVVEAFQGESIFDKLTKVPDSEGDIRTSNEIRYTVALGISAYNLSESEENIDELSKIIIVSLKKSDLLSTFVAELGAEAGKNWKEGKEFMGVEPDIPEGREGKLVKDLFNVLAKWDKEAVTEDVETILNAMTILKEYGVNDMENTDEFLKAFSQEEFAEDLCVCLFKNKDLAKLVQPVIEYGLGSAFDTIGLKLEDGFVSKIDISKMTEKEVRNEVKIVSKLVKTILKVSEMANSAKELSNDVITELTDAITELKNSKLLGEIADKLMTQITYNFAR